MTWGILVGEMTALANTVPEPERSELRHLIDRWCQVCTQANEREQKTAQSEEVAWWQTNSSSPTRNGRSWS